MCMYRDYLPTVTEEQQKEGVELLKTFRSWWEKNVIPSSDSGCINTIMVLPWSNGEPDYRDKYRESAQKFTGIGFFFYNLSPYAGAPELIVPGKHLFATLVFSQHRTRPNLFKTAGQTSYISRLSECQEFLPAAIGLTGNKGSDIALAEFVSDFLGTENGVEVGPVAFKVAMDKNEYGHTHLR